MDKHRAEEIMQSKGYIEVIYGDRPVWIESINRDGKAQVRDMTNEEIKEVSFADLDEADGAEEI